MEIGLVSGEVECCRSTKVWGEGVARTAEVVVAAREVSKERIDCGQESTKHGQQHDSARRLMACHGSNGRPRTVARLLDTAVHKNRRVVSIVTGHVVGEAVG